MATGAAPISHSPAASAFAALCVGVPAALFVWLLGFLGPVSAGEVLRWQVDWAGPLDVSFAILIDGLALLFALLITGIGALILLYATSYMKGHRERGWFLGYMLAFLLSMLGLVLADNLIALFLFWELTTITSFLLIGFDHAEEKSRWSARQALIVTGAGGLALLAGAVLIWLVSGTFNISEIDAEAVRNHAFYPAIMLLVLAGCFTKSAQFPFHFWLPNAMAAPTPVSAFLHSATMVKGGVYLMARLNPALATDLWSLMLVVFGATTAVLASIWSLREQDFKQVLAYTTLMALGTLTLFIGIGSDYAITGAMTFIFVHALYKAGLFLVIGIVDHATGTRDQDRLGGLARLMPITAAAATLLGLSMAGLPPFIGFIGKELLYKGTEGFAPGLWFTALPALAANAMMVAAAMLIAWKAFFRPAPKPWAARVHEPSWRLWLGPAALAGLGLIFGPFGESLGAALIGPAADAVLGDDAHAKLKLWAGVNLALLLSVLTIALGGVLFWFLSGFRGAMDRLGALLPFNADRIYDRVVAAIEAVTRLITPVMQPGVLRYYLMVSFAFIAAMLLGALALRGGFAWPETWQPPRYYEWMAVLLIVAATWNLLVTRSRLAAISSLGIVGASIGILFLLFSAPDLAITQLLVETLSVILITMIILKLPSFTERAHPPRYGRVRDAVVAGSLGLSVTLMLMTVAGTDLDRSLSDWFETASYPQASGRNIVNVILVDFRALDTLGEIAVIGLAALAIFALIKLKPKDKA